MQSSIKRYDMVGTSEVSTSTLVLSLLTEERGNRLEGLIGIVRLIMKMNYVSLTQLVIALMMYLG